MHARSAMLLAAPALLVDWLILPSYLWSTRMKTSAMKLTGGMAFGALRTSTASKPLFRTKWMACVGLFAAGMARRSRQPSWGKR
eukprot:10850578-Alexandrium_andersonii.AAC.1